MARQQGRGGIGSHKHGVSGHAGKSPKMRMAQELEARRQEREHKSKPALPFERVQDALKAAGKRKPKR
jgi:hypothetical protein